MKLLCLILSLLVVGSLQNGYNEELSKELWTASSLSYFDKSLISGDCGKPCQDLKGFKAQHQFVKEIAPGQPVSYTSFVNKGQNKVVIAFRGTDNPVQLVNEGMDMGSKDYKTHHVPGAQATNYFYSNYKNYLKDDMMKEVKKAKAECPKCDFYFTGHSLGGAFTTHGALDVAMSGVVDKSKLHLYTFGSPKVGNDKFAEAVNKHVPDSFRVTHNKDPVPHLGGSHHVGTEVFLKDGHKPTICKGANDPNCSKKAGLNPLNIFSWVGSHETYHGQARNVEQQLKDAQKKHQTHPVHPSHPVHKPQTGHPTKLRPVHTNGTHPGHHTVSHPGHHNTSHVTHKPTTGVHHPSTHHNTSHVIHKPTTGVHHPTTGAHHPSTPTHKPTTGIHHPSTHHNTSHVIHKPTTGVHRPSTPIHKPTTGVHHPSTPIHKPTTGVHHPSTPVHKPTTGASHSTAHPPVQHKPTPAHQTPVHHNPTPVQHKPAPVQHKPVPVHHTPAPVHHTPAPVHHAPAPVHHTPAPVHHPQSPKPTPKPAPAPVHHPQPQPKPTPKPAPHPAPKHK